MPFLLTRIKCCLRMNDGSPAGGSAMGESTSTTTSKEPTRGGPGWLIAVTGTVIALVAGTAAGFIYGDRQGRSSARQELDDVRAGQERALADLQTAQTKLASAVADSENEKQRATGQIAAAVEREQAAARRASEVEAKLRELRTVVNADAGPSARHPKDEPPRAEITAKKQPDRPQATRVVFKEFVRSPEQFENRCIRIDGVRISGDLQRMRGEKLFSATVSSEDHQYVYARQSLDYAGGLVFVMPESLGRELSSLPHDFSFKTNLCCEVSKNGKVCVARIYRIETRDLNQLWAERGRELVYEDK
jgi:hypothetical protein